MSIDFISIDFETANSNNSSACSIGLVAIKDNKISETYYSLIKPYNLYFEKHNTDIHGITADDVTDAPLFKSVWEDIKHYFNGNIVVAHNASFDMFVLKLCLMEINIPLPKFNYICSIPFSTRACSGEGVKKSLKGRAEYFGIELEDHHNALCDAMTCAKLVLKCIELKKRRSFSTYLSTFSSIPVKDFDALNPLKRFGKSPKFESIKISEIRPNSTDIDDTHVFYDKNIVFTGVLTTLSRRTAMQIATDIGANVRSGVNKKTNYLIVGAQDKKIVGADGMSNKEELAYALNKEGLEIEIISEQEFIDLSGGLASVSTT